MRIVSLGDMVKKVVYIFGVCILSVMIFHEFQKNAPEEAAENVAVFKESSSDPEEELEKIAYLTFDDGPSEITPDILDTLKNKKAKATFFLVGNEITAEREQIVKRELEEGHSIGVHTFSHKKDEMYCNEVTFFDDFNQCRERIRQVTGILPKLHRFPWGSNNGYVCPIVDDLLAKLKKENVVSYDWNVSGEDSVGQNVPKAVIYKNVAKDLEKYDQPIILLHDSNSTKNTSEVLGEIIDLIAEKGYTFGTLDEREEYTFPQSWRK
jgi:peptidoglycan/xylan/chitin deacetylase (PgdA/CDA1 family)